MFLYVYIVQPFCPFLYFHPKFYSQNSFQNSRIFWGYFRYDVETVYMVSLLNILIIDQRTLLLK